MKKPHLNSVFDQMIGFPMLWAGWQKVKSRHGGPGGDGVTIDAFDAIAEPRLQALHAALASGGYWPAPARVIEAKKPSGGARTLRIPAIVDRVVQTAAALVLTPILDREFEDASFGYRPGRSVGQAVARVAYLRNAGYVWTVDGDIRAFFDEVPHAPLLDRFDRVLGCARTTDLVERWLQVYCDGGRGLPQGMPLSPVLSNLYLDSIDEKIEKGGVRLVRFADDFLLLCRSEAVAEGALARMTGLLREAGLQIHPEKTAIRRFEDATRFLGHMFVRGLVMEDPEDGAEHARTALPPPPSEPPVEDLPEGVHSPRLRWVYVHEPGRVVTARGNAFVVLDAVGGDEVALVHPGWADGIEIGPAAAIDDDALRLALAMRLPVVFVAGDGSLAGTLDPAPADRADLHLAQARLVLDPAARTDMVRRLVRGRMVNQRQTLKRLNAKRDILAVDDAVKEMRGLIARLPVQGDVDALRGMEGRGAAVYWTALQALLDPGLGFKGRERRPPPDPYNVAVSYMSTRLAADMQALILRHGLHPGFACLHACQDGRPNLALDLMEEFRAPLVEGAAVTLFRQGRLKAGMFVQEGDGRLKASSVAIKAMIIGYESRLRTSLDNPADGKKTNWRGLMEAQVIAYRRHCHGEGVFECYNREA
jgi:CRISPR-associated protein Cas1